MDAALYEAHLANNTPRSVMEPLERASFFAGVGAVYGLKGLEPPTNDTEPWESGKLLRAMRNALVHGKAEWASDDGSHAKLSRRITTAKLPMSPFVPIHGPAFPLGCMSAGVAEWAAETAGAVIRQMSSDLEIPLWE
jgi:hypothetical protein